MNTKTVSLIKFLSLILSIFAFFAVTQITQASYGEEKPPTPRIMIEKWVWNPGSNSFVENLSVNQFLFLPDQEVKFKLEVKNTGDKDLDKVEVTDKLPKEVSFVSGPGSYDKEKHSLTFIIDKLKKGEAKSYEITVKVKKGEDLPSNVFCMSNLAEVKAENMVNQDTASFCAQKQVLGVTKELPKTGPATLPIALGLTILTSSAAIFLTKKS